MTEQNSTGPAGEVSLDILAEAPSVIIVEVPSIGGREGDSGHYEITSGLIIDARTGKQTRALTSCVILPAIGQSLRPVPRWVTVEQPDGGQACLLSGRWTLAELLDQADENLKVLVKNGRLFVEFDPTVDDPAPFPVVDFDLRVRLPADVESASGTAAVSGTSAHWSGVEALRPGGSLSASSRLVPLPQEVAPWLVGALAVLIVGLGIGWTRDRAAAATAIPDETANNVPTEDAAAAVLESPPVTPAFDPDPDSPWRPPH